MSMVDEIADFLAARGHGTLGTNLFRRSMPPTPDDLVCVIQWEGDAGEFVQDNFDIEVENPRLQVRSRSKNPASAEAALSGPYGELMRIRNEVIGGTRYISIMPLMAPSVVERDDNGRYIAQCDFAVRKEHHSV